MQLGMIGLGRMGANMVRRLIRKGHDCVVFDRSPQAVNDLVKENAVGASSLQEFVKKLAKPNQTLLAVFGPRDFMGEMSIIECVTRSASVRALEKTSLFGLRGIDLYRLFQRRPDQYAIVILNIARDLSRRLRALDEKFSVISH